jgi:hypothetical protein
MNYTVEEIVNYIYSDAKHTSEVHIEDINYGSHLQLEGNHSAAVLAYFESIVPDNHYDGNYDDYVDTWVKTALTERITQLKDQPK